VVQVVKYLPSKREGLSLNPVPPKLKQSEKENKLSVLAWTFNSSYSGRKIDTEASLGKIVRPFLKRSSKCRALSSRRKNLLTWLPNLQMVFRSKIEYNVHKSI
jgi:hypothetical protein